MTDFEKPSWVDGIETRPDGALCIHYTDEASVRRALARLALAAGWGMVREEVVVPGWGRIDLVLGETDRSGPYLIELKLDLSRPADVRKAFQQVDGYARWWAAHQDQQATPVLSSCKVDGSALDPVQLAYPHVPYYSIGRLMDSIRFGGGLLGDRLALAEQRLANLRREVELHEAVVASVRDNFARTEFMRIFSRTAGQPFLGDVDF